VVFHHRHKEHNQPRSNDVPATKRGLDWLLTQWLSLLWTACCPHCSATTVSLLLLAQQLQNNENEK
jgi:hypothetical protein